ncbi:class I SAM-dependent methyltransferase [Noviherbaspirillum aerium]|uniref:class I SAM-dependent methyltransferase n=1 Tax=Noviherbaspirillum aerium TaxID=2588497 RepID=UPI00124C0071|nr:class I SAM-dependent methyltransferase [Noviherbaspirillum aerium]
MHSRRSQPGASPHRLPSFPPAVQALLIQLLALLATLGMAFHALPLLDVQVNVAMAVLLQGGIAAALTRWRRLAPWWPFIQFLFPLTLVLVLSLGLPSWIYLSAFSVLLILYWSTFRTQVPYYPSRAAVWHEVERLLPSDRPPRFIDIGSGFGGLTMHLARRRPDGDFAGIELAPLPWFASLVRARLSGSRGRFLRGDYADLDFGDYDVIFAYLSPAAMPALASKAMAEMKPGSLLLSHEFAIPGVEPQLLLHPGNGRDVLYGWYR